MLGCDNDRDALVVIGLVADLSTTLANVPNSTYLTPLRVRTLPVLTVTRRHMPVAANGHVRILPVSASDRVWHREV